MTSDVANRREFLKMCVLTLAVAPVLIETARQSATPAQAEEAALPPKVDSNTDPLAKGLGYTEDASTVDTVKYPKRKLPEAANQFCRTCALFSDGPKVIPGWKGEWGKCAFFQGKLVSSVGWCMSWTVKPAG